MLPSYCSDLIKSFSTEDDRGTHDGFGALITTSQTLSVPSITGKGIIQDKCDSYDFFWKWKADLRTCPFDVPPCGLEGPGVDIALAFWVDRQLMTNVLHSGLGQKWQKVQRLSQRSTACTMQQLVYIWTVAMNKKARQNHKSRHGTCCAFLNQDLINAELTHVNCKLLISGIQSGNCKQCVIWKETWTVHCIIWQGLTWGLLRQESGALPKPPFPLQWGWGSPALHYCQGRPYDGKVWQMRCTVKLAV